jgi:hypothetical protein
MLYLDVVWISFALMLIGGWLELSWHLLSGERGR